MTENLRRLHAQDSPAGAPGPPGFASRMRAVLVKLRWPLALAVVGFWVWFLVETVTMQPMDYSVSFENWYGNWTAVLVASAVFLAFVFGFLWPRGRAEWRSAGVYSAFLISLFAEMFGLPLTIYLVAPLLDLPAPVFGLSESHLWAFLLNWYGILPLSWGVYLVMSVSAGLITGGVALLAIGWAQVFRARHQLATTGLYGVIRHPQYLGLILIVIAFNIQWPTFLTLAMAPVLIVMYVRQARREDRELAARFGGEFVRYASRVPAFIPRFGTRDRLAVQRDQALTMHAGPAREGAAGEKAE